MLRRKSGLHPSGSESVKLDEISQSCRQMGAHFQAAFFKAGGKKDREAWRGLEPLEIEQRAMA